MIQLSKIKTDHKHYSFVEGLLEASFPAEERRNADLQRANTDGNPLFHCCLVEEDKRPVGLMTYWHFDTFIYIEHFAIDPKRRGYGYGTEALKVMLSQAELPVVLEVEIPLRVNDVPHRRIGFYKRIGFQLRKYDYKQPPYRWGDEWLPMKLMTYGTLKAVDKAVKTIYREVYGVTS